MVGQPLALALLEDGWDVYGASRFRQLEKRELLEAAGVHTIQFDMRHDSPRQLPEVQVLFLEVWDAATWASDDQAYVWDTNYFSVGRVVERYAGVADIVNGCTINVYGDSPDPPDESTPCRPTTEYGRSRYAQERLVDFFCYRGGKKGIHLRYAHANSATQGVIHQMAEAILRGDSLGPNPDAKLQVIGLEDFVRVTKGATAHMKNPPELLNCCGLQIWTQRQLADTICQVLGTGKVVFDRETGGLENSAYADVSRMLKRFGQPRVSVEVLIDRAVKDVL
jgi:nucleoside-diphosphate-sugar epimerase